MQNVAWRYSEPFGRCQKYSRVGLSISNLVREYCGVKITQDPFSPHQFSESMARATTGIADQSYLQTALAESLEYFGSFCVQRCRCCKAWTPIGLFKAH